MYIAFKWLLGMAFAMWVAVCGLDVYVRKQIGLHSVLPSEVMKNVSKSLQTGIEYKGKRCHLAKPEDHHNIALLLCLVFVAGALTVSLFNKKEKIIVFTVRKLNDIKNIETFKRISFEKTASQVSVAASNYSAMIWTKLLNILHNIIGSIRSYRLAQKRKLNISLLHRIKEIGEEKKRLTQILISATNEINNVKMQYKLETLAKNRLEQHVENTQKILKENRSKYVSFQQLYIITHQENIYLKSRVKKLYREKDEAEKNLIDLMNQVYKSKNSELKAYCSRFIVKTKDNLLNSDVNVELEKFLRRSRKANVPKWQSTGSPDGDTNPNKNWQNCTNLHFTDSIEEDVLVPLVSDAPKLKGLPGEYVWTVKDKDGIIEKLYEYDIGDLDNGETIRRIRQYSVYHDTDCLLDISSSRTILPDSNTTRSQVWGQSVHGDLPSTSHGFLTGSEAFQQFLKNNNNILCRLPGRPSLCD